MLPASFVKGHDQRRLRNLLVLLFLALAIPTALVIRQAFDQLKWEAWYQYRTQAESLTTRIDTELARSIRAADAWRFADFAFANAAAGSNVLQRSPLSAFPVEGDVPGTIGFFQVSPDGRFSSPLLPASDVRPEDAGLPPDEIAARRNVAEYMTAILAENALVSSRSAGAGREQPKAVAEEIVVTASRRDESAVPETSRDSPMPSSQTVDSFGSSAAPARDYAVPDASGTLPEDLSFEQSAFDELGRAPAVAADADKESRSEDEAADLPARAGSLGKVQDLRLDDALEKKNEALNRQLPEAEAEPARLGIQASKRRAEPAPAAPSETDRYRASQAVITTFDSETDPFELSMLGSGHLVLYRNAWQDGARYIQGALIDRDAFSRSVVESAFVAASLSGTSELLLSYDDDIIDVYSGPGNAAPSYPDSGRFDGELLYRARLTAPFDHLELIYSIDRLPPGPGARVLMWTTLIIAIVFTAGFYALYRLGLGQIRLARQQQDFVSAVSHELKTPLTSIRMYGEMLKEGWADEEKRKQYYEYIHEESERLTRLISNVLHLARISRNEPQFDLRDITLGQLMDQVRSKIASQAERAGFEIELALDEQTAGKSISVDDDCFAQIIINLVDNALKFSRDAERKKVDIHCALTRDGDVRFSVRDYGPGIPKDQLRKIFRLFYRSGTELTRETVGTGIGLAIVHQLTTAMGGKVDVVNVDPGAEFRVRFPVVTGATR